LPGTRAEFQSWRARKLGELRRLSFRGVPEKFDPRTGVKLGGRKAASGVLISEPGISIPWKYLPARGGKPSDARWLVVLGEDEPLAERPEWLVKAIGDVPVLLISPRGSGPTRWQDPAPFYIQRSLPLLGQTVDTGRLTDVLAASAQALNAERGAKWKIIGRGQAGVLAVYAALLEPRLGEVAAVDPPASHRDGPIFLNVLRVLDVPEAFGLLAPRPLTIATSQATAFDRTQSLYRIGGGNFKLEPRP
jgi:hypothetical protein